MQYAKKQSRDRVRMLCTISNGRAGLLFRRVKDRMPLELATFVEKVSLGWRKGKKSTPAQ